jgi:hypothetical protein
MLRHTGNPPTEFSNHGMYGYWEQKKTGRPSLSDDLPVFTFPLDSVMLMPQPGKERALVDLQCHEKR